MPNRAVVQSAGYGYRLRPSVFRQGCTRIGPAPLRFTQALFTQMAQTAGCNRRHSVDRQLCRWLLPSLDPLPQALGRRGVDKRRQASASRD